MIFLDRRRNNVLDILSVFLGELAGGSYTEIAVRPGFLSLGQPLDGIPVENPVRDFGGRRVRDRGWVSTRVVPLLCLKRCFSGSVPKVWA